MKDAEKSVTWGGTYNSCTSDSPYGLGELVPDFGSRNTED